MFFNNNLTKEEPLEFTYNHSSNTVASIETGDYATYISQLKKHLGIENIETPQQKIVINGVDYFSDDSSLISTTATVSKQIVSAKSSAGLNYIGEGSNAISLENLEVLLVGNTDSLVYKVDVPQAGNYNIVVNYITTDGKNENGEDTAFKSFSSSIERKLLVITSDEEINKIFEDNMGKQSYVFSRVWKRDSSGAAHQDIKIMNGKYDTMHSYLSLATDTNGNDVKPSQVEEENVYVSTYLSDYMGYVTEPYQYYFTEGENTLVFSAIKESIRIHSIEIVPVQTTKTYAQYVEENQINYGNEKHIHSCDESRLAGRCFNKPHLLNQACECQKQSTTNTADNGVLGDGFFAFYMIFIYCFFTYQITNNADNDNE